jgi:ATP-dependent DNA helicase RecG
MHRGKRGSGLESQNVEWKETWRDEYLKWICGFANAQGGILEIGRNNKGSIVGLHDAAKLLEELPVIPIRFFYPILY